MDLNKTIRRLRLRDAELARNGNLPETNPDLHPLHVRVMLQPDLLPEFVVRYCESANVLEDDLFGPSRLKQIVTPRHVLIWWMATNTHLTVQSLGKMFNRHHASIIHAKNSVNKLLDAGDRLVMFHVELTKQLAPLVWVQGLETKSPELAG